MNLNKENANNSLALAVDHNCLELISACVALLSIPDNLGAGVNTAEFGERLKKVPYIFNELSRNR